MQRAKLVTQAKRKRMEDRKKGGKLKPLSDYIKKEIATAKAKNEKLAKKQLELMDGAKADAEKLAAKKAKADAEKLAAKKAKADAEKK